LILIISTYLLWFFRG